MTQQVWKTSRAGCFYVRDGDNAFATQGWGWGSPGAYGMSGSPCPGGSARFWSSLPWGLCLEQGADNQDVPRDLMAAWQAQETHCGEGLTQALLLHPFRPSH